MIKFISLGCVAFIIIISLLTWLFWQDLPHGAESINESIDYERLMIIAVMTFLGVISNSVFERITKKKEFGGFFNKADVILAALVAPIVILPVYQSLMMYADPVIIALTSYQNGFFFNVIFDKVKKSAIAGDIA